MSHTKLVSSLLLLAIAATTLNPAIAQKQCRYPAIFSFGASNADTGGMAASLGPPKPPNGESYFHGPAGRFCDGRIILDFMAQSFGLPFVSPYLDSLGTNFSAGANFATYGSTIVSQDDNILRSMFSPFNLGIQFQQFQGFRSKTQTIRNQGGAIATLMPPNDYFAKALYTFDIGQNDLTAAILTKRTPVVISASIPKLVNALTSNVKDAHGCVKQYNEMAMFFNNYLKDALVKLRQELPAAKITYVDVYAAKYSLFSTPEKYGFEQPLVTCCGYGGKYNYNVLAECGEPINVKGTNSVVGSCPKPSARVIWDGIHYTEAANKVVFELTSAGNNNFTDPPTELKMSCNTVMMT
ncbi:hypothetical protein VNO78_30906 [Psophocarpus tetragonolobus]|uniref:Uncharacterized protein n=1 Tax=Psophocarpus tetragonolobus TaxID=3891 RepID=A0AAN9RXI7_PSOTE